jgi:hypothetical protein
MHFWLRNFIFLSIAPLLICHAMESEQYFSCHDLKQILAPHANFKIPENGEKDRWCE